MAHKYKVGDVAVVHGNKAEMWFKLMFKVHRKHSDGTVVGSSFTFPEDELRPATDDEIEVYNLGCRHIDNVSETLKKKGNSMAQDIKWKLAVRKKPGTCNLCGNGIADGEVYYFHRELRSYCIKNCGNIPAEYFKGVNTADLRDSLHKTPIRTLHKYMEASGNFDDRGDKSLIWKSIKDSIVVYLALWLGSNSSDKEVLKTKDASDTTEETETTKEKPAARADGSIGNAINNVIALALENHTPGIDEKAVRAIVSEEVTKIKPKTIEIKRLDGKTQDMGLQHKTFEDLLNALMAGNPAYMHGPAGSFKTKAAEAAAEALGVKFYCASVSQQTPEARIKGFFNANGEYVRTLFREAFENGGVFLLDEIDNGNPNTLAALNAAADRRPGEFAEFPDGMVERHKDFYLVAAANTIGKGADMEYVGRCPIDAATLNRFQFIAWVYDEEMETAICRAQGLDLKWTAHVQKIRKAIDDLQGVRVVCSPRASFAGGRLLLNSPGKYSYKQLEEMFILQGVNGDTAKKIREKVKTL